MSAKTEALRSAWPSTRVIVLAIGLLFGVATGTQWVLAASAPPPSTSTGGVPNMPFLRVETGMHGAVVNRIAVDPAGRFFVTVSDDKTVRLWRTSDGSPISVLRVPIGPGEEGALYAAALSPDGRSLLVGGSTGVSWDRTFCLYLFDVAAQRLKGRFPNLPAVINQIAFSPDGQRFAVAFGGRIGIKLYDVSTGRILSHDSDYGDRATWVAYAKDGRFAVTSFDGRLRLYDTHGSRIQDRPAPGGRPYSVAFAPDGRSLAVGYFAQPRVDIVDGHNLQWRATPGGVPLRQGGLSVVAWGANDVLYAGGAARDASGAVVLRRWARGGTGQGVDLNAGRDTVAAVTSLPDGGVIFGTADPRISRIDGHGRVVFTRDRAGFDFRDVGQRTLALSSNGLIVDVHPADRNAPFRFDLGTRMLSAPAGSLSAQNSVSAPRSSAPPSSPARVSPAIQDWRNRPNPKIGSATLQLEAEETSRSVATSADGARVVLGTDYYVRVYDSASARELHRAEVPAAAWGVAISSDGRTVVAALGDGTLRWFSLDAQGRLDETVNLFVHGDGLRWVAWTVEGFFDHSDIGGKELVGYQVNRGKGETPDWYSFAQMYRLFYAPNLVSQKARGQALKAISARLQEIGDLRRRLTGGAPPRVDLVEACYMADGAKACVPLNEAGTTRGATRPGTNPSEADADVVLPAGVRAFDLRYTLSDRGGGVGTVDIFLNHRNVSRTGIGDSPKGSHSQRVPVDAGQNRLQLRVYDGSNGTFGQSRPIVVVSRAAAPSATAARQTLSPRLFVVSVGIDAYTSSIKPLRFAVADAKDFARTVRERAGRLYTNVTMIEPLRR